MTLAKGIAIACFLVLPEAGAQPVPFHPEEAGRPGWFDIQLLSGQGSYLGVGLMELDADRAVELEMQSPSGVEISSVAADSPAEEGGLLKGDVILDFRGEAVAGVDHFVRLVRETPVGREVPVVVWRDGARTSLTVVIGRRSQARRGVYRLGLECKDGEDCHHPMFDFTLPNFDFDMPRPRMMLKSRVLGAELEGLQKNAQLAEFFGVEAGVLVRSVDPNSPRVSVWTDGRRRDRLGRRRSRGHGSQGE